MRRTCSASRSAPCAISSTNTPPTACRCRRPAAASPEPPLNFRHPEDDGSGSRVATFDHDGLDLAGAIGAAEGGGLVVLVGREAGDALREGRKFDHHEALKFWRPFHDLELAAAGQNLAAKFGDDRRHQVGVLLILDRIVDLRARDPIGWHWRFSAFFPPPLWGRAGWGSGG